MTIMMMSGGACQVHYPCGHGAVFAADQTITLCRECDPALRAVK
jgi:hypothetical protein